MKNLSNNAGATRQGLSVTGAWKVSLPAIYHERCRWVAPMQETGEFI